MNLLKNHRELKQAQAEILSQLTKLAGEQARKQRHEKVKSTPAINCDSWTIVRPATETDNRQAKGRIINRLRKAFWL